MPDVVIVGGGITGLASAYELARTGHSVTVLEARALGAMASRWTLGGVRQSGRHPAELPLARRAVVRWAGLGEELGHATGYTRRGNLRLARTEAEVAVIRRLVRDQRAAGLDLTILEGAADVRAVAPALSPAILAASFCPSDGSADPDLAVEAYAAAARRHGATIREGVGVREVVLRAGRVCGVATSEGTVSAESVVVAAGVRAPALLAPLGLRLPLHPKVVNVIQTVPVPFAFEQVFGVANADCAGRREMSGRLRVTTGIGDWREPIEGWTEEALRPPAREVARLIGLVGAVLPAFADAPVSRLWGGLIDQTPDALPVIDAPAEVPGLVVAAGFSGHGFGIAPVSGEAVAALATGGAPPMALDAFRLDRFTALPETVAPLSLHG